MLYFRKSDGAFLGAASGESNLAQLHGLAADEVDVVMDLVVEERVFRGDRVTLRYVDGQVVAEDAPPSPVPASEPSLEQRVSDLEEALATIYLGVMKSAASNP